MPSWTRITRKYIDLFRGYPNPVSARRPRPLTCCCIRSAAFMRTLTRIALASLEPLVPGGPDHPVRRAAPELARRADLRYGQAALNGTMASPAGHPFWLHLATLALRCRFRSAKGCSDFHRAPCF